MSSIINELGIGQRGIISFVGAGGKTTLIFRIAEELANRNCRVLVTTTTKMFMPGKELSARIIITESHSELLNTTRTAFLKFNLIFAATHKNERTNKVNGFSPEAINTLWRSGCFDWILIEADGAARKPLKAPAHHEPAVPTNTKYLVGLIGLSALGKPVNQHHIHRLDFFLDLANLGHNSVIDMEAIASLMKHPNGLFKNCPPGAKKIAFMNQADTMQHIEPTEYFRQQMQQHPREMPDVIAIGQASEPQAVLRVYSKLRDSL